MLNSYIFERILKTFDHFMKYEITFYLCTYIYANILYIYSSESKTCSIFAYGFYA